MCHTVKRKTVKPFAYFLIFFAGMGGILYGYDLGVIAGALLYIKKDIMLSDIQESVIVGAVLGGGSIAILISGLMADIFGRRTMISAASLIFLIGTGFVVSADSFLMLLSGRLVQGIAVGIVTIVTPLYLAETAPSEIRGRSVAAFQLMLTAGILIAYLVDMFFTSSGNWRAMFACVGVPGILLFLGSLKVPESPRWLLKKKKFRKVRSALSLLHDENTVDKNISEMEKILSSESEEKAKGFTDFIRIGCQKKYFIPFIIAFSVACLTQLTGINCLLQYDTVILDESGLGSGSLSMLGSTGVGLMNFAVTFTAILLVDRFGRRPLILLGTAGAALSLFFCAFTEIFMISSSLKGYLIGGGMAFFILFYAVGPGVVVWLAISELLPLRIRSMGMAACLFANSMVSTLLASFFLKGKTALGRFLSSHLITAHKHGENILEAEDSVGFGGIFIFFAFTTLVYFILAAFFMPETKNKTLEEIEESFAAE